MIPTKFPSQIKELYSAEKIAGEIDRLAKEINEELPPDPMVVGLLKGSFVFAADLIRAMHHQKMTPQVDFLGVSSYGKSKTSSGTLTVNRDISEDMNGRAVLLIDDILETGRTLRFASDLMQERGAASVHIAVLLHKPGKQVAKVSADFTGFTVPDLFVVGYGLDYANSYRELPFIGVLE